MPDYSKTRIQLRRGTAAELAAANPVLGVGEPAFATDTNALKIGDGSTAYSSLSAISGGGGGGGSSTFVGLSDTPANFTSAGSKFLKVNSGASALEFVAVSPLENIVEDTTPQLGGNLDINSNNITGTGNVTVVGTGTFVEIVKSGGTSSQFLKADGSVDTNTYITSATTELSEDSSPQLGGALDSNGNNITMDSTDEIQFGSVGVITDDGSDLLITEQGAGGLKLQSHGNAQISILAGEVVINDSSEARDFRVEGDADANLIFADSSTDRVGIGTSTPSSTLHVNGIMTATTVAKTGGASTEFLKADGSVDTNTYLTAVSNIDTTNFNSSNLIAESDSIASNDNDTTIPTSAAVKAYADTKLASDTSSISNSVAVNNVVLISQSNYDALGSYDANTLYFIN